MGDPTNNGPLGTASNSPGIDPGTLARTCRTPPCASGHAFSLARKSVAFDALAMFDLENAVIWVNDALLAEIKRTYKNKQQLQDIHIQTLVHEFTHVMQYEDIFEKHNTRGSRAAAMIKHRAEKAMNSTEDEFVKYVLNLEGNAELQAQLVSAQLLHAFSSSQGWGGIPKEDRRFISKEKALEWFRQNKKGYANNARKTYRKIRQSAKDHGGSKGVAAASARKNKETYTMLEVSKFRSAFPTKNSPKLKALVGKMVKFDIVIVVGLKGGKK
jgi:hypothetical protein